MEGYDQVQLLRAIHRVQTQYIDEASPNEVFEQLLQALLELTESEYGFIGEVEWPEGGPPYLRTRAISPIAWTEEARETLERLGPDGLEFRNLETLFGAVITSQRPVLANHPSRDPRRGGLPDGHPPLDAFLGVPFFDHGQMIGVIGIANRSGGYEDEIVGFLEPFLSTCSSLLRGYRTARERRAAEAALRQKSAELEAIYQAHPDLSFRLDRRGLIRAVEAQGNVELDRAPEEFLGKAVQSVMPPAVAERVEEALAAICAGAPIASFEYPLAIRGEERHYEARLLPLMDDEILALIRDITERRKNEEERRALEARVQHTQKLESLGVLAGAIAHDFNNLLTGILGNSELALAGLPPSAPERPCLEDILSAGKHAAGLCHEMLAYSGKAQPSTETIRLSELIEKTSHLLKASISKQAELRFDLDPDGPLVAGDPSQLHQVVMNLITNASDALGERAGVIHVSTGVIACDQRLLSESYIAADLPEGRYAFVEVADDGCGMGEETLSRIFEPFYSNKLDGRGLGLATVLGVVRGHRGAIRVQSQPGAGTRFRVLLPTSAEVIAEAPVPTKRRVEDPKGVVVLVVDDEDLVRRTARRILERVGSRVLEARDGREALEILGEAREEIHAVLLDMNMPHMSGDQTYRELRRRWPRLPVVLCSGYDESETASRFARDALATFLHKPFTPRQLLEKLAELLEI